MKSETEPPIPQKKANKRMEGMAIRRNKAATLPRKTRKQAQTRREYHAVSINWE